MFILSGYSWQVQMPRLLERPIELFFVIEGHLARQPLFRYCRFRCYYVACDVINCRATLVVLVLMLLCSHEANRLHEECGRNVADYHWHHKNAQSAADEHTDDTVDLGEEFWTHHLSLKSQIGRRQNDAKKIRINLNGRQKQIQKQKQGTYQHCEGV